MALHIRRQVDELKKQILGLGAQVEDALMRSIQAIEERDVQMAHAVIDGDQAIDREEVEIEEQCLSVLALNQPVAFDLRYLISTLKINAELERIGDLAGSVAEQAIYLSGLEEMSFVSFGLPELSTHIRQMVHDSLDALVEVDAQAARKIIERGQQMRVDTTEMHAKVEDAIGADPGSARVLLHLLNVTRTLERVAGHSVNIAEDVIYMAEGCITRLKVQDQASSPSD